MFLKTVRWVLVLLIPFIFVACGGSSGDYFITQTGTLNDSKVTGVSYSCGSNSGLTTANGEFSCRSDSDNIEFHIGSVILGSIKTTDLKDFTIYPADLVGVDRSDTNSSKVVNILQILQSLDSDKNPNNGIVITEATREVLAKIDTIRLDENSTTQADLNATLAEVGRELIKADYAIAHYEDTLRYEINSTVDSVPPAPAIITQKSTNKNLTPITIYGERGAKIFVDGDDSTTNIDNNHTATINLDTTGDDGYMSFIITLQDNLNKVSDELNLTILKDTVPPPQPTVSTYPEYVNDRYDSVNVTILGEENATLFLNDRSIGTIHNGELSIDLDTSGSDGAKSFDIILMDLAGNRSEPLAITITRDTVAPSKPTIVTSSALVDGGLHATIMGEVGTKVYIDGTFYGIIAGDGKLNTTIPNPSLSYYETLHIKLVDLAGNESPILSFTTTFSRVALTSNATYYIPQNMTLIRGGSFDGEGIIMAYQTDEVVAGSVIKVTLNGNETLKEWLNRMVSNINRLSNINSMTQITQQQIAENLGRTGVITEYSLQTRTNIGTVSLISLMLNSITDGKLSNLPSSSSSAITSSYFNIIFSLVKESSGETYLTISIVPNHLSTQYHSIIASIINTQNIIDNSMVVSSEIDLFEVTTNTEQKTSDFLFVVDDSGSMGSYQRAVSKASRDFVDAISNTGINFRIGIITTSSGIDDSSYSYDSASRVLHDVGIIENDISLFKNEVIVGSVNTYNTSIETGIYNAERALQSKAFGDRSNGLLTQLGMPLDKNTSLSIIMLSDEKSQYEDRAGSSFDVNNNLFIKRGYRVYSIVNPHIASISQYDDLATKTGGSIANITNTSSYSIIMNSIAQNATGDVGYKLKNRNIIESTIYVTVNGNEITHNSSNGWKYVESYNSILFYGTAIPTDGDKIKVSYWYAK